MSHNVLNHYMTKIEGHGRLKYSVKENLARVEIDEGERLFEKLVVGQKYSDVPFITARICGVCPTAHTLAAISAIENAFDIKVNDRILSLRRALLASQIVQSHALHLFFLALPDYMGVKSGLELHEKNPNLFKLASRLKGIADKAIEVIGGRAIHPVTPVVGGFLSAPSEKELEILLKDIKEGQRLALEALELFAGFEYPYLKRMTEYFSLSKNGKVDILGDTITSSLNVSSDIVNYSHIITEKVKPYSSAKFGEHEGHGILVGAIARTNLMEGSDFHEKTEKAIASLNIKLPQINSFKNNLSQAIELLHFLEETESALLRYQSGKNEPLKVPHKAKAGTGVGAIEAPRGTLYHMYEFDENGIVKKADIITPTAQNLTNLEDDCNEYLRQNKQLTIAKREKELEMLIRAYDPCITCSVH